MPQGRASGKLLTMIFFKSFFSIFYDAEFFCGTDWWLVEITGRIRLGVHLKGRTSRWPSRMKTSQNWPPERSLCSGSVGGAAMSAKLSYKNVGLLKNVDICSFHNLFLYLLTMYIYNRNCDLGRIWHV